MANYKNIKGSVQNILSENYGDWSDAYNQVELYTVLYNLFVKDGVPVSNGAVRLLNRVKTSSNSYTAKRAVYNCMNYNGKPKHKPSRTIDVELI